MPLDQTANFVRATLASAIAAGDSTIALADSGQLVDPANGAYNLVVWNPATYPRPGQDPAVEIVRATALDSGTNTLTVDRGQEGTAAADHAVEAVLQLSPTAKMFADIDAKTSALSADGQTFAGDAIDVGTASIDALEADEYNGVSQVTGDAELDDALSESSDGDEIVLYPATYSKDRTISKRVGFRGVGVHTLTEISGEWTLDESSIHIRWVHRLTGTININKSSCSIIGSTVSGAGFAINVNGDANIISGVRNCSITLDSGTNKNVVDSCIDTTVTDNGTNTIGDIS